MKQPKIDTAIYGHLLSSSPETVVSAIQSLGAKGNAAYLPVLFDLLSASPEPGVRKAILNLLATIKDKAVIPVIMQAIQNQKYSTIRKDLTTICWQNGLDYCTYMEAFIQLIIDEDWEVAFEAFTVIENFEHFPPEDQLKELKLKIARALRTANEQKQYFLEEILKMLSE